MEREEGKAGKTLHKPDWNRKSKLENRGSVKLQKKIPMGKFEN